LIYRYNIRRQNKEQGKEKR